MTELHIAEKKLSARYTWGGPLCAERDVTVLISPPVDVALSARLRLSPITECEKGFPNRRC